MLLRTASLALVLLNLYLFPITALIDACITQRMAEERLHIPSSTVSRREALRKLAFSAGGLFYLVACRASGNTNSDGAPTIASAHAADRTQNPLPSTPALPSPEAADTKEVSATNVPQPPVTEAASPFPTESAPTSEYPWHHNITASFFWAGEGESDENDKISNVPSAWNSNWVAAFGGVDTPTSRNPTKPYWPAGFTPLENPFYFALPAAEFNERGLIPGAREASPWANESVPPGGSLFKNRWIEIIRTDSSGNRYVCYAQWQDVGPAGQDGSVEQYGYVFGNEPVVNNFGIGAGIDLSPACGYMLGLGENVSQQSATIDWRFIDEANVPQGPWKEIVTTSGPNWS